MAYVAQNASDADVLSYLQGLARAAGSSKKRQSNAGPPGLATLPPELVHLVSESVKGRNLVSFGGTSKGVQSAIRKHSNQEVINKAKNTLTALNTWTQPGDDPGVFMNKANLGLQQSKNIIALSPYISNNKNRVAQHTPTKKVMNRVKYLRFCFGDGEASTIGNRRATCLRLLAVIHYYQHKLTLSPSWNYSGHATQENLDWACEHLAIPGVFPRAQALTIKARTGFQCNALVRALERGALPSLVSVEVRPDHGAQRSATSAFFSSGKEIPERLLPLLRVMQARADQRPGVRMTVDWLTAEATLLGGHLATIMAGFPRVVASSIDLRF